jgi:hypothetical protein
MISVKFWNRSFAGPRCGALARGRIVTGKNADISPFHG